MMMLSFGAMGLIGVLWVLYGYAIAFPCADGLAFPWSIDPSRDRPAEPARDSRGRRVPAARLRRLPGDLRDHHRRARLGCDRRPRQVRLVDDLRRASGRRSSTSPSRAGSSTSASPRTAASPTAAGSRTACRSSSASARSTSPVVPRCTSTPVPRRSLSRSCSASASASRRASHVPHNPPFVLLGAGLLWFGWFGFNAGSELAADNTAALAFVNTIAAPAAALLALADRREDQGRQAHLGRRRFRCRRRSRRDHPGLCVADARSGRSSSASSPVPSAPSRSS